MNILIASIFSIDSYSRGIMPDVLQSQIDKHPDSRIFFLSCSNTFDVCYFNTQKQPDVCYRCKVGNKNTLGLIKGDFVHLKIKDLINEENKKEAKIFFKNKDHISFEQVYENFEVGEATLSTYISRSRDRELKNVKQEYVKELALNALALYLGLKKFLEKEKIDIVYNFNGRQDYVRAVMRAAQAANLDCYNVERTRLGGHIDFYKNILPHNIRNKWELIKKYWEESSKNEEEKKEIGASFYKGQKEGKSIIFPSYTAGMEKGKLPDFISNNKRNLVLFNSSDDEHAALGEDFKNPFFKDQNDGLNFLTNLVGREMPGFNLIIRMHPNLVGIGHQYVNDIKALHQKFPNIFVIRPEENIDSYSLMECAEKVITFGSTTGLEANFKGIPVILLNKCYYYYSNVAYVPTNKEEVNELLKNNLSPKPTIGALKFGFFYMQGGIKTSYYYEEKMGEGIYFKGKRIHFYKLPQRIKAKLIQIGYRYFNLRFKL